MDTVILDFETFYSTDYSLKKLGIMEYVRDPRFKAHGVGIKVNDTPTRWSHDALEGINSVEDWDNALLVGHNLYFDASILFEHYGIVPKKYCDTRYLFKGIFSCDDAADLNSVAEILGFGSKIKGSLDATKGIRDLPPELLDKLGEYCIQDVELTHLIYHRLLPVYEVASPQELELISLTTRMAARPILHVDGATARRALAEAETAQQTALTESPVAKTILASNQQFAKYLTSQGMTVPTKISKTTGKATFALGQNDPEFIGLMAEHPEHQKLWAAREAVKSTIGITRATKFLKAATMGSKLLPMPLTYYGAKTGRWSGTDGMNVQNLPRGGLLRQSIYAPEGVAIVVVDSSQIELRVNAWFCNHHEVLNTLRNGQCVYRLMASALFNKTPNDVTKQERSFAKAVVLGCGYGMGANKFKHFCASGPLGMDPIHISDDESRETIRVYRTANRPIADMWYTLDGRIGDMLAENGSTKLKAVEFAYEAIVLPNGMALNYEGLHQAESGWFFGKPAKRPLWGGTVLENVIQALARIIVAEQMLKIDKLPNTTVVGMTHDEVLAVCPLEVAEDRFNAAIEIMSTPPAWAPDLPLGAEGGIAVNYSK